MELRCYIFFTALLIVEVVAYPLGPPVGEADGATLCDDLMPSHGAAPQTTVAPYQIKTSTQCYNAEATISVRLTLDDMATEDNYFEGFLLMARKDDGTTMSVGTFDALEQEYIDTLDCHDTSMSAVGHSAALHFLARTVQWTAPASDMGDLIFIATFVHETEEFWVNVTSSPITFDTNCAITTELADETFPDIEEAVDFCQESASHRPEGVECDSSGAVQPITTLFAIVLALRALIG